MKLFIKIKNLLKLLNLKKHLQTGIYDEKVVWTIIIQNFSIFTFYNINKDQLLPQLIDEHYN